MISLKDKIDSFYADRELTKDGEEAGPNEEDRNDIIAKQAIITSEEAVQELAADPEEILKFAYELRKQDVENKYSFNMLNGQVRPPALVEMILANKWDSQEGKMTVDAKDQYSIMSGDKFLKHSSTGKEQSLLLTELESEDGHSSKFDFLLTPEGLVVGSAERALVALQHGQAEGGQHQLIWGELHEE